jgi:uncharacterized protein YbgA (DUF1722 family)/uncharacterized protein YbbK (DUF523 family)
MGQRTRKTTATPHRRICLGISGCLLGEKVRYDGADKRDGYITGTLARFFELVPVCPEVAIGLGVPRPPIRLVGSIAAPHAVGIANPDLDVTDKLAAYGRRTAQRLDDISGYILKSKSPSCGMERVKVYTRRGRLAGSGRGIYAAALMAASPLLPVEEESHLGDPDLRENFFERVFAYWRWQDMAASGVTAARLIEFHTSHKLTLMAHNIDVYRRLGRFVAGASRRNAKDLSERYIRSFMAALAQPATPKRHANVLMHVMGYLKKRLDADDKAELLKLIDAYRLGQAPRIVPLTLLRHHFRCFPDPYVARQVYLNPGPEEIKLCG